MARPAGHELSAEAWEDILRLTGRNLSQIAEVSGVPRSTISGLLGRHHAASIPTAYKIAAAVGVRAETLFPSLRPPKAQAS